VEAFMKLARESLGQARWDLKGGFLRGAGSGAYYTMFYAATAALLVRGQEYSQHKGVAGAFGKEFARTGQLLILAYYAVFPRNPLSPAPRAGRGGRG
jgi:uncharacterized protein (UPF0332 family)